MKKRLAMLVLSAAAVFSLTACGDANCKHNGCDEKIEKDGYCAAHYLEHALEDAANALGGLLG